MNFLSGFSIQCSTDGYKIHTVKLMMAIQLLLYGDKENISMSKVLNYLHN